MAVRRAHQSLLNSLLVVVAVILVLLAVAPAARGQMISIRTVPVATGDQFLVLPSLRLGMGSVTIAIDDPWLDPFLNPALGANLTESAFLAAPTFYGIEGGNGAGRTVPLGALFSGDGWFGGGSIALQQIVNANGNSWCCAFPAVDVVWEGTPRRLDDSDATNTYASAFFGRRLGEGWAVGVGGSVAGLNAVDGVDLLYANSQSIEQDGGVWAVNAGLTGDLGEGKTLEAAVVHSQFSMEHDVRYLDWRWDPQRRRTIVTERVEENLDQTRTTGLQLILTAPVGEAWRAGPIFTVNRKSHPKIPNYDLMSIPRDPGHSWAFDIGAGLGHERGPLTFGVDVIYEPVWSETWAEAADTVRTAGGVLLKEGDRTVENDFFLANLHLRLGLAREVERWGFQLGLQASSRETELDQWNVVTATRREEEESWMEWTPSLGAVIRFPDLEVRYAGWFTTGTGRPSVDFAARPGTERGATVSSAASDFLVAASGPLTLQEARVTTHQLSVRLPLR
jgi:hypothetical protein